MYIPTATRLANDHPSTTTIFSHYKAAVDFAPLGSIQPRLARLESDVAYSPLATEIEMTAFNSNANTNPIQSDADVITPEFAFKHASFKKCNQNSRSMLNYDTGFYYVCWQCEGKSDHTIPNRQYTTMQNQNRYLIKHSLTGTTQPHVKGVLDALIMHQAFIDMPEELRQIRSSQEKIINLAYSDSENIRIRLIWCIKTVKNSFNSAEIAFTSPMVFHATFCVLETFKTSMTHNNSEIFDISQQVLKSLIERNPVLLKNCLEFDQQMIFKYNDFLTLPCTADTQEICHIYAPFCSMEENYNITINPDELKRLINEKPYVNNLAIVNDEPIYVESFSEKFAKSYNKFAHRQMVPTIATYFAVLYFILFDMRMTTAFIFGFSIQYGSTIDIANLMDMFKTNANGSTTFSDQCNQLYQKITNPPRVSLEDMIFPVMLLTLTSILTLKVFGFAMMMQCLGITTALFMCHNIAEITSPGNPSGSMLLNGTAMAIINLTSFFLGVWTTLGMLVVGFHTHNIKVLYINDLQNIDGNYPNLFTLEHMDKRGLLDYDNAAKQSFFTNKELWHENSFETRRLSITTLVNGPSNAAP